MYILTELFFGDKTPNRVSYKPMKTSKNVEYYFKMNFNTQRDRYDWRVHMPPVCPLCTGEPLRATPLKPRAWNPNSPSPRRASSSTCPDCHGLSEKIPSSQIGRSVLASNKKILHCTGWSLARLWHTFLPVRKSRPFRGWWCRRRCPTPEFALYTFRNRPTWTPRHRAFSDAELPHLSRASKSLPVLKNKNWNVLQIFGRYEIPCSTYSSMLHYLPCIICKSCGNCESPSQEIGCTRSRQQTLRSLLPDLRIWRLSKGKGREDVPPPNHPPARHYSLENQIELDEIVYKFGNFTFVLALLFLL